MTIHDLYPPPPIGVPANFTRPSAAYRLRAMGVLASLFAFLLLYLALIAAVAWSGWWVALHPPDLPKGRGAFLAIVAYLGGLLALGMLLVFLVKGLFKGQRTDRSLYLELKRNEQPKLFEFIERICDETSAPRPAGVYMSPDVNAAVFYDTTLLNLVLPPRKYLLIGAGLVNAVNMREFQAVLAHEFGHFSQKSMALGTYVYVANRVLGDVVFARDSWDDWLRSWCGFDIRISFPAWGLLGVVWLLRTVLGGVFKAINLLNLALARQMEFNADDVAVSVAGSDAIVTTLCRVEFADRCHGITAHELLAAADHGLYTSDLFHHQERAADHLRALNKQPGMGIPAAPPERVFDPAVASNGPAMWSSHPPNHHREANAKRKYFAAPADERSPWLLFDNAEALRSRLSQAFYKHALGKPAKGKLAEPGHVQAFIDAERAETSYDPKYYGLFDNRRLQIGDPATVPDFDPDANLPAYFAAFPPRDLAEVMAAHEKRQGEMQLIAGLKSGNLTLKGSSFPFRDRQATQKEVPKLFDKVNAELEADSALFAGWDRAMYAAHYQAAHRLDPARADELRKRYEFQLAVQNWIGELNHRQQILELTLGGLGGKEIQQDEFRQLTSRLQDAADQVEECLTSAKSISCPEMSSVPAGTPLSDLVGNENWSRPRFRGNNSIDGAMINNLMTGLGETLTRLRRIYFKGLGNILKNQERIAADFAAVTDTVNLPA